MVSTRDHGLIHVCEKCLTATGVARSHNRLLLPTNYVKATRSPSRIRSLARRWKGYSHKEWNSSHGFGSCWKSKEFVLKFQSTKFHVLDGQSKDLVEHNGLKANVHMVHVSAFHCGEGDNNICVCHRYVFRVWFWLYSSWRASNTKLPRRKWRAELKMVDWYLVIYSFSLSQEFHASLFYTFIHVNSFHTSVQI